MEQALALAACTSTGKGPRSHEPARFASSSSVLRSGFKKPRVPMSLETFPVYGLYVISRARGFPPPPPPVVFSDNKPSAVWGAAYEPPRPSLVGAVFTLERRGSTLPARPGPRGPAFRAGGITSSSIAKRDDGAERCARRPAEICSGALAVGAGAAERRDARTGCSFRCCDC